MRIVMAPDSFKESLSAAGVAAALAAGWRRVDTASDVIEAPMADGGEGTVDALLAATGGRAVTCSVTGPLGTPVEAGYGLLDNGATAVIEMAAASGLPLVAPEDRDPGRTTTRGTGELMVDALERGVRKMILAIGGSATNDGGAGMAQALGYRLLDAQGAPIGPGGLALNALTRIDATDRHPRLDACDIRVACDVDNPLCGPRGASQVFGPQKGASPEIALALDAALAHFAEVLEKELGKAVAAIPGAGAAGGLGAGLLAFAGARLESGVALVAEACRLTETLAGADLVLTGEGRLDGQSSYGKTPVGVAKLAQAQGIPVIAVAGALGPEYAKVYAHGIDAVFSICPGPASLEAAYAQAPAWLADTAEGIARIWRLAGRANR